ncbi:hypothetical protein INR49_025720 [Caranx melampygus]|nr:hypothetical protein INR49_025720 [Caranx melampygus]
MSRLATQQEWRWEVGATYFRYTCSPFAFFFTPTVKIMQMTSDVQAAEDRPTYSKMANRRKDVEEEIYDKVVDLTEYAKRQRWWNRLFGSNSGPIANNSGYIQVDWKRVEKDVNKAKKQLKKSTHQAGPELNTFVEKSTEFVKKNIVVTMTVVRPLLGALLGDDLKRKASMATDNQIVSAVVENTRPVFFDAVMALPFLPGNSPNKHLGKDRFHKSQHFDYTNGVPVMVGSEKPGIGGELLPGQRMKPKHSVYPKGQGHDVPLWVAFDKQALCFEAYFQEAVPQAQAETYRIRKCKIHFFPEDDTIQVMEPEFKNSGIPQGTLIRRQRIPLPAPNDDQFYSVFHFNINQQMVLYSRTFTVTSCDSFTRNFLTKLGCA